MRISMEYHWETVDAQGQVVQHAREPHIIYDEWVGGGAHVVLGRSPVEDWQESKRYVGQEPTLLEVRECE